MSDPGAIARRVGRLRDDLCRTDPGSAALARALDDVDRSLDRLGRSCRGDDDLSYRLEGLRATAASYVRATAHLTEAGVESSLCEDVLRRGRARVIEELAAVEQTLLPAEADC